MAQKWVESRFWLDFVKKKTFDPLLGRFQPMTKNPCLATFVQNSLFHDFGPDGPLTHYNLEKTKGQQLKGKIVSALFHTFPHFFTLFPLGLSLKIKLSLKRIKENKKKLTKPFCTLVVARLSSDLL